MIEHLVWFKLKPETTSAQTQELLAGMRAMIPQIDAIQELSCGEDFSGRSRGFGVGLRVRFLTRDDLQTYDQHPAHQAFIARFKPLWDDVTALDFQN